MRWQHSATYRLDRPLREECAGALSRIIRCRAPCCRLQPHHIRPTIRPPLAWVDQPRNKSHALRCVTCSRPSDGTRRQRCSCRCYQDHARPWFAWTAVRIGVLNDFCRSERPLSPPCEGSVTATSDGPLTESQDVPVHENLDGLRRPCRSAHPRDASLGHARPRESGIYSSG